MEANRKITEVSVVARFDLGVITPVRIIWRDGRRFAIDRVLDVCEAASTRTAMAGTRYRVLIAGHPHELWRATDRWYVEEITAYPYG